MSLPLLLSRRFAPLFWCQFFAAFNDNFLKTALVFVILFHPATADPEALITSASAVGTPRLRYSSPPCGMALRAGLAPAAVCRALRLRHSRGTFWPDQIRHSPGSFAAPVGNLGVATLDATPATLPQGAGVVFASALGIRVAVDLCGLAIAGGLFIVPAFAAMQAWSGADYRARSIAVVSLTRHS